MRRTLYLSDAPREGREVKRFVAGRTQLNQPEAHTLALIGLNCELQGEKFELGDRVSIGRSISSDIFLPDPAIGRLHCQIEKTKDGYQIVQTCRDSSPVLNGNPVRFAPLTEGDRLALGRFELQVTSLGQSAEPEFKAEREPIPMPPQPESGVVLTVHAGAAGPAAELRRNSTALFDQMREIVEREQGSWISHNWLCKQAVWRCSETQSKRWQPVAARVACLGHQLAFLNCRTATDFHVRQAVAFGDLRFSGATEPAEIWGAAADRSLALALQSRPGESLLDASDGNLPRDVFMADGNVDAAGAVWLRGMHVESEGRRWKMESAQPVTLKRFGLEMQAILLRAMHDPENDRLTFSVLCHAPVETDADYLILADPGKPLEVRCSGSRQAPSKAVQAHFTCSGSTETLYEALQLPTPNRTPSHRSHAA